MCACLRECVCVRVCVCSQAYHFFDLSLGGGFRGIKNRALIGCMSHSARTKRGSRGGGGDKDSVGGGIKAQGLGQEQTKVLTDRKRVWMYFKLTRGSFGHFQRSDA